MQNGTAITKQALLEGLTVDGVAVKEIVTDEETGENTNGGNVIVHFDENEDGSPDESAITRVSIFLDNAKTEWTIASTNAKFTCDENPFMIAEQKAFEEFQDVELTAGAAGSPATLSGKVVNLDEDEAYELHVYMGAEKESGDYSVCEPIQIPRGLTEYSFADIAIPVSGELAASGEYYVSAALVRSQSGDFNGDGAVSGDTGTRGRRSPTRTPPRLSRRRPSRPLLRATRRSPARSAKSRMRTATACASTRTARTPASATASPLRTAS